MVPMAPAERVMKGPGNKLVNGWPSVFCAGVFRLVARRKGAASSNANETLEIWGTFEGVLEYLPTFFVGMVFTNTDHFKFCSIPK